MAEDTMDVYLIEGCSTQAPVGAVLGQHLPALELLGLPARLLERRPGFLGLDLPASVAHEVLAACKAAGARGSVVTARYRRDGKGGEQGTAGLSIDAALDIADRELDRMLREQSVKVPFEPTRFVREEALWWVFCRPSEALIAAGHIPGALFVAVDKLDGHVWSEASQAEFLLAA